MTNSRWFNRFCGGALASAALLGGPLWAQTGVSDDRVNLPEGPGSLDGVGDNTSIDPNMGMMRYTVPVQLPIGFQGTTPSLALAYGSGGGSGVLGIGWSLDMPSIERATLFGLPEYSEDDHFVANGGDLLVRVSDGEPAVYRARIEGGFARYNWHANDGGGGGYWRVEQPNGLVSFYGADSDGDEVVTSRLEGAQGVFRYMLVDTVDALGNRLHYDYQQLGTVLLPSQISWAYVDGAPLYQARFNYEGRADFLSDCRPGFNARMEHRLESIEVLAYGDVIRTYHVEYQDIALGGGMSRVSRVYMTGLDGSEYPIDYSFDYSQSLGATCSGAGCESPYLVTMPSLGVDISAGTGTLVDLNGDALPDFVDTANAGAHRVFFNRLVEQPDGSFEHTFEDAVSSTTGTGNAFGTQSPYVQVLDVNGDGFTDMINAQTGRVLPNQGSGDWGAPYDLVGGATDDLPDFADDFSFGDNELAHVRFLDFDSDRRIDVLKAQTETETTIYRNAGDGTFVQAAGVGVIGASFAGGLQMADMNGDGLTDPTRVLDGEVSWKLNLGRGRWTSVWTPAANSPDLTVTELDQVELEDLNGDALDDLVLVSGNEVRYWLNRGGVAFDVERTIDDSVVSGIPERTSSTTVLFADMNGNGSSDVIWVTSSGAVTYLEIFPVRPNLLTRLETGLGLVTEVTYGTSVEHMSRDGGAEAWDYRLPFPMNVVDSVDTYDRLNDVRGVTEYTYHNGFYDGVEKQFRGYSDVEIFNDGDASDEASLEALRFEVGADDPYRNGLQTSAATFAVVDGERIPINASSTEFEDCDVAGVPTSGLTFPVRSICATAETTLLQERRPEAEWVELRNETDFDGYGNAIAFRALGVVSIGGGACAPCGDRAAGEFGAACGPTCEGDEQYGWEEYIEPGANTGGRWLTNALVSSRRSSLPAGNEYTEVVTYYDGDPFVGLARGQVREGLIRRSSERVNTSDEFLDVERMDHDEYGNIVEFWGPRATTTSRADRRLYSYTDGLFMTRAEVLLTDSEGLPITLAHEVEFNTTWAQPSLSTGWYVAEDEDGRADGVTTYDYDAFGRIVSRTLPGDSATPTMEYVYELGSPSSRIISRSRSTSGGPADIESVQCMDGFGRTYQTRDLIDGDQYYVSGFKRYNRQGSVIEAWQVHVDNGDDCAVEPPAGVLSQTSRFDAIGREVASVLPDGSGEATVEVRSEFLPLGDRTWDQNATDPTSPAYETTTTRRYDGQNRVVAVERSSGDGQTLRHAYAYDVYGYPSRSTDPEGHTIRQFAEPIGYVTRIEDPHRGERTFDYDLSGNLIAETNARGVTIRSAYDGADRIVAQWDDSDRDGTLVEWTYDRSEACPAGVCSNGAGLVVGTTFPVDGARASEWVGYTARGETSNWIRQIAGTTYAFQSRYDNAGRMVSEVLPGDIEIAYERDGMGRLTSIPGLLDGIRYDERGLASEVEASNGAVTMYTHDSRQHLVSQTTEAPDGSLLVGLNLRRDNVGNVLAVDDTSDFGTGPSMGAEYDYDAFNRLVEARLDLGRAGVEETIGYSWSGNGNLTARTSSLGEDSVQHAPTIGYGGGGASPYALTSFGDSTFEYDAGGFMTRRNNQSLTWDGFGRLTSVTGAGGTVEGEYAYDAGDARAWKREGGRVTLTFNDRFEVRNGIASVYVDIDDVRYARLETDVLAAEILSDIAPLGGTATVATPEPDGAISAGDAWASQAAASGAIVLTEGVGSDVRELLASSAHRLLLGADGQYASFYHHDHIGSIVATTGETGEVLERNIFYPDGAVRFAQDGAVESFGYSGKEHDASGLLYYGARYLDPTTGRWISPDPTFDNVSSTFMDYGEEASNPYGFARGNPINNRDPDGRFIDNIVGAVIGGLGGALISGVAEYVTQRHQVKLGLKDKISWKTVFGKAAISGVAGALVGASGLSGLAAIAVGVGIKAAVSGTSTFFRWKRDNNRAVARDVTKTPAERSKAATNAKRWQAAATGLEVTVGLAGAVLGGIEVAGAFGADVPNLNYGDSITSFGVDSGTVAAIGGSIDLIATGVDGVAEAVSAHRAIRADTERTAPAGRARQLARRLSGVLQRPLTRPRSNAISSGTRPRSNAVSRPRAKTI